MWKEYGSGVEGVRISFINKFEENIELYENATCTKHKFTKIERSNIYHTTYQSASDWGLYNLEIADIEYVDCLADYVYMDEWLFNNFNDCKNIDPSQLIRPLNPGLIKERIWSKEKETRIRVALRPIGLENTRNQIIEKPIFECIYMRLHKTVLNNIRITMNPWINEEYYDKLVSIITQDGLSKDILENSSLII